jgi:acyl-CoA dehydrogenase
LYHIFIIGLVGALGWLIAKQASATVWSISLLLLSLLGHHFHLFSAFWQFTAYFLTAAFALFAIKPLRQRLLTQHIMKWFGQSMPTISSTEREALEAGTVGWEGELFTGNPDFSVLMNAPVVNLTEDEQAFLDGPVNALCRMIDDVNVRGRVDHPDRVW